MIVCHSLYSATFLSQSQVLQLSFCICGLPGHMFRTKELLLDMKECYWTVLPPFSLFHIKMSVHVCEYFREDLIYQGIVNLECITLMV